MILAGIIAVALWVLLPKTYTTSSLIKVAMQSDSIVGDERARVYAPLYEVEKGTQLGLVRSPFVLQAALRAPGISNLSIVKKRKNDIITWLKEELRVSYPGNAELMEISLSGDSPSEVAKLVQGDYRCLLEGVGRKGRRSSTREIGRVGTVLFATEREGTKGPVLVERLG